MSNTSRQDLSTAPTSAAAVASEIDAAATRALVRPVVLMQPDRMVHPPSWLEHIPFAFWLIDVLRPRVMVELGTHSGNSYAAFAQAVQRLNLETACYAVDTWKGDAQAGFYDESVFTEWKAYHDGRYTAFSTLVRTTFDDAVAHFPAGGIDLLNIDGYHTAEAAAHDFNTWLPKMSSRGIVLIHDINVRERDFGAWITWQELSASYPSFSFLHGHGLGVLAVGTDVPADLEWLLEPEDVAAGRAVTVRQFFARAGGSLSAQYRAARAEHESRAHARRAMRGSDRRTTAGRRETDLHSTAARRGASPRTSADGRDGGGGPARAAGLDDTIRELQLDKATLQRSLAEQALELSDGSSRLRELEDTLTRNGTQLESVNASLEAANRRLAEGALALAQADTHIAGLQGAMSERDDGRAVTNTLAMLPAFAFGASRRALAGTLARLRALAGSLPSAQPAPSRSARAWSTLQAMGMTPGQIVRRPRRLATMFRLLAKPHLLKDAHLIVQSRLFDSAYYQRSAPDVTAAGANALVHFVMIGGSEGRSPCVLFDSAWYLASCPEVAAAGLNPLAHYLRSASREDLDPHPLFWARYYREQLGGMHPDGVPLLQHYVTKGMLEGRSPHPLFDPEYYAESCGGALTAIDPLAHFLDEGAAAGLNPHPLFDIDYYLKQLPPHERSALNPVRHYLTSGTFEGRRPHALFDPAFYRATNGDVAANGVEPLTHYVQEGGREGRQPSPAFDGAWYLASYPDVAVSGTNPLAHYLRYGWLEGRNPSPRFHTTTYLGRYPDVTRSGINPLVHYLEHGAAEGRSSAAERRARTRSGSPQQHAVSLRASNLDRVPAPARVILCLTHVMPVEPRAGNEYRINRMLTWLSRSGYTVIPIVAPADGTERSNADVRAIAAVFGNAVLCQPSGRVEYVLRDIPDVLHSLDGELTQPFAAQLDEGRPWTDHEREMLQLDRSFCSDTLLATVLRLQTVLGPYVLLAEYIWMSRVLPLVAARALKIIDTIDVFSSRNEKVGQFGVQDLTIDPAAEAMRLDRADVLVAIQQNERLALRALAPDPEVITGGVDFEVIAEASIARGRQVLYVASDNPMNRHGLRDFLRFAWPRVRESVPEAELLVVGAVGDSVPVAPAGVTVLGRVADLAPLYRGCRVAINPAVAGTGVKIKTLEALAHLRRVVTWPNGVDGLSPAVAGLCRTVQDWYSFSEHLVELLRNDAAAVFSPADRDLLAREASPAVVYAELAKVLEAFFDQGTAMAGSPQAAVHP